MANKTLFKSLIGKLMPATNAFNEEGAPAYALSPKHQLAQYAATGCLNTTFYATADEQLAKGIELCAEVDTEFIAKTAVFCREQGFMKDMPALLAASLSVQDHELLARIFPRVKHCSVTSSAAITLSMQCRRLRAITNCSNTRTKTTRVKFLTCRSRC